ncbi:hypothetical protein FHS78_001554 [Parvibaculum indicum]|uniref:DUF1223 domain-containing protein n=1 Tax=Parvibaculum indicum TaxID=562969 RepID=UPI00141F33DE|nr:DUF1223 domain-containing protein [Parvibaculum indicum]NIJ41267.1 hypothetical protein [Parvibaculum indicum]
MRKPLFHIALALAAGIVAPAAVAADTQTRPVIVELFTSQGCSSCPPADAYLRDLTRREDVLPLSFNVDYWDYLGWRDTLASPDNTARQRAYGRALGLSGVYTPQMVVDGAAEGIGSNRREIDALIAARKPAANSVSMSLKKEEGRLTVSIAAGPAPEKPAVIWLVRYAKSETVGIERGENRGETITYANVVRGIAPIGMWDGRKMRIMLPGEDVMPDKDARCVVLLQEPGLGRILAVAEPDMRVDD